MQRARSLPLLVVLVAASVAARTAAARPEPGVEPRADAVQRPDDFPWTSFALPGGTLLEAVLLLPEDYDPGREWPVLLALPPGGQDAAMVEQGLALYFRDEALRRGWVVVSPAAPAGTSFARGGEALLGELVAVLGRELPIEGGRPHLAGVSNGGRAALALGLSEPDAFASLTLLPGMLSESADDERLERLARLPIAFHVGGEDQGWLAGTRELERRLVALGARDVEVRVHEGEGHVLGPETAGQVFERLERLRAAARERAAVVELLERLPELAAERQAFGAALAAGARLLWPAGDGSREGLRAWLRERAARGFALEERRVELAPDARTAWFEERRAGGYLGTGVLLRGEGGWRLAQAVWQRSGGEGESPRSR